MRVDVAPKKVNEFEFLARQPFHRVIGQLHEMGLIENFQVGQHEVEEDQETLYRPVVNIRIKKGAESKVLSLLKPHYLGAEFNTDNHFITIPSREDAHHLIIHELKQCELPSGKFERTLEVMQRTKHLLDFKVRLLREKHPLEKKMIREVIAATKTRIHRLIHEE